MEQILKNTADIIKSVTPPEVLEQIPMEVFKDKEFIGKSENLRSEMKAKKK